MDDADVGRRLLRRQLHVFQRENAGLGQLTSLAPVLSVPNDKIAFEPQAVISILLLAQGDKRSREAIRHQTDFGPFRQQRASNSSFCTEKPMAPSVASTRHSNGKARSP